MRRDGALVRVRAPALRRSASALLAVATLVSGCSLQPLYRRPDAPVAPAQEPPVPAAGAPEPAGGAATT